MGQTENKQVKTNQSIMTVWGDDDGYNSGVMIAVWNAT
jgi:hypothetical protein